MRPMRGDDMWYSAVGSIVTVLLSLLAVPLAAAAQPPGKVYRIGYLGTNPPPADWWDALLDGLRERGYSEGRNLAFERRLSQGQAERFPKLAAELVQLGVDLILVHTTPAAIAARNATQTIPIVFPTAIDPVGAGLVASLARPGGNMTGLSTLAPELSGKRLELLKEVVPKLSRVAVFGDSTTPGNAQALRETEPAAKVFKVPLQYLDVLGAKDIESAFREASKGRADAVLVLGAPILISQRKQIADLAVKNRLPAMYGQPEYVE